MDKKNETYNFKYVNNSETIMLFWVSVGEDVSYKIYFGCGDGEFKPVGTVGANYFITDAGNTKEAYIEAYTKDGEYISTSQIISVEANSNETMEITAVRSYNGVTLTWSENDHIGNYYITKKIDGNYFIQIDTRLPHITINNMKEGDSVKIVSYQCGEDGETPVKISSEFVFSQDKLGYTAPESPKVSVIIPVYNNEKFMVRCIDLVLASSLKETEVIIVDDGSTDNSGKIADWYRDNYPGKVTVIHTENRGAGHARNVGIEAAKGEYIAFADSDDFMSSGMYRKLYEKAVEFDCDISMCSHYMLNNSGAAIFTFPFEETGAYDSDWLLSMTYSKDYKTVAMWNKIYRAELVKAHPLPEIKKEDASWIPVIYSYAQNFCYVSEPLYCYDRTVTNHKSTVTTELHETNNLKYANEFVSSFNSGLLEGNQNKRQLLMQVYIRLVVRALLAEQPQDALFKYVEFLLIHKEEILSNEYIAKDKNLADLLNRIYAQFSLDENNQVLYHK